MRVDQTHAAGKFYSDRGREQLLRKHAQAEYRTVNLDRAAEGNALPAYRFP